MDLLYDAVFHRKSVLNFSMEPLSTQKLQALSSFLKGADRLCPELALDSAILGEGEIGGRFAITAPHYLCLYSEAHPRARQNAGFLLEQADLWLSSQGIGACWLGLAKPKGKKHLKKGELPFVIMLAFGMPFEPLYRESAEEFRRKSIEEITDLPNAGALLEAVRLAPSFMNSQPWFISGSAQKLLVCRKKRNFAVRELVEDMNRVDIGIALCCLALSAKAQGKKPVFSFEECPAPKDCIFEAGVCLE